MKFVYKKQTIKQTSWRKKMFNINTWSQKGEKDKTISWTSQSLTIAYLKDTIRHMKEGKVTKLEVVYAEESKKQPL